MSARTGCLLAVALAVLAIVLSWRPLLNLYGGWWQVQDPEARSDVAVILDGGEGERMWQAGELWNRGLCGRMVITGRRDPVLPVYAGGPGITQAEAKREIAIGRGIPADSIEVLLGPTSTYEEAEAMKAWCEEHRWVRSITVVTSPFHTRRARATFRHVLRETALEVRVTHAPWEIARSSPRRWWTREKDLMAIFGETVKTLFYMSHYRIRPF